MKHRARSRPVLTYLSDPSLTGEEGCGHVQGLRWLACKGLADGLGSIRQVKG